MTPRWTGILIVECAWVFVICVLSECCTYFDKTQWCLVAILCWLISISFDIGKEKDD